MRGSGLLSKGGGGLSYCPCGLGAHVGGALVAPPGPLCPPGPMWPGPLWASLGPCGHPGPLWAPWAHKGQALEGRPLWAPLSPHRPGHSWASNS